MACSNLECVLQTEKELWAVPRRAPEEEIYLFDLNSVQEFANLIKPMGGTRLPTDSGDGREEEAEDQGPDAKDQDTVATAQKKRQGGKRG